MKTRAPCVHLPKFELANIGCFNSMSKISSCLLVIQYICRRMVPDTNLTLALLSIFNYQLRSIVYGLLEAIQSSDAHIVLVVLRTLMGSIWEIPCFSRSLFFSLVRSWTKCISRLSLFSSSSQVLTAMIKTRWPLHML